VQLPEQVQSVLPVEKLFPSLAYSPAKPVPLFTKFPLSGKHLLRIGVSSASPRFRRQIVHNLQERSTWETWQASLRTFPFVFGTSPDRWAKGIDPLTINCVSPILIFIISTNWLID
jgi:hypothetical protein